MKEYFYKIKSPVTQASEAGNFVDDLVYARLSGNKSRAKAAWKKIEGLATQEELREINMFFGRRFKGVR